MTKRLCILIPVFALAAGAVSGQDAKAVLQKASSAMGNANSIQYTGSGKAGLIGQSFTPVVDWPMVNVTAYTRTIDYASRSSREEMTRIEQTPRPKGGGAPFAGEQKQVAARMPGTWPVMRLSRRWPRPMSGNCRSG